MPEENAEGKMPESKEPDTFDRDYVERLREEAKGYRLKLRDTEKHVETLTTKVNEFEDSNKSELERLTSEKARLEREIIDRDRLVAETAIKAAIQTEAVTMGLRDPDAAFKLVDTTLIEFDDGDVKGVKKALEKLIKSKPYLIEEAAPPPSPGAGGPPVGSTGAKDIDTAMLGFMKGGKK